VTDPVAEADPPPRDLALERLKGTAAVVALMGLVMGFLASLDLLVLPRFGTAAAWSVGAVLLLLAMACGYLTVLCERQVEVERWQVVAEPHLTEGERTLAHQEAERKRRAAALRFFAAPVLLGYWMAYQAAGPAGPGFQSLLVGTLALPGYAAGLVLARLRLGPEEPPEF
jgi:hypothetical protein